MYCKQCWAWPKHLQKKAVHVPPSDQYVLEEGGVREGLLYIKLIIFILVC